MSEFDDLARRAQELEIENRNLKTALSNLEKSYDITRRDSVLVYNPGIGRR